MEIAEIQVSYSNIQKDRVKINGSPTAFKTLLQTWNMNTIELNEDVKVILLNRASEVLGVYHLAKGGVAGCFIDVKLILSVALKSNTSSIILVHNHPSGNLLPSDADKSITTKLKKACEQVDLNLLDHLIISKDSYLSFKDEGLI